MVGNEDEFHGGSFAIPRTLRALAGNSISHFSLADAEECLDALRATKMESKAGKVKFHIR
jgi:hypothetical protein